MKSEFDMTLFLSPVLKGARMPRGSGTSGKQKGCTR